MVESKKQTKVTKKVRRALRRKHRLLSKSVALQRTNSVTIGGAQVIDFGDPVLREAFRLWWHPYDMGPDFDELVGAERRVLGKRNARGGYPVAVAPPVRSVIAGDRIRRRELDPDYYRRLDRAFRHIVRPKRGGKPVTVASRKRPSARPAPVKVVVRLDYPLSEPQEKVVSIDRRYPGEVFALAHDFYRELYAQDEADGGKPGPMNGGRGPLLNRGRGPLVWGHDLGDLVFESCQYRRLPAKESERIGAEGVFTFGIGS